MQNNTLYTYINIIHKYIHRYIIRGVQAVCAFSSTDSWYFVYKTENNILLDILWTRRIPGAAHHDQGGGMKRCESPLGSNDWTTRRSTDQRRGTARTRVTNHRLCSYFIYRRPI